MRARLLFLALLLLSSPAVAQTTGTISGHTLDESGAPLSNVTVDAAGPPLLGSRTDTSDASGNYRLSLLPPGTYTVKFTVAGAQPVVLEGIVVGLGRDTALE